MNKAKMTFYCYLQISRKDKGSSEKLSIKYEKTWLMDDNKCQIRCAPTEL